MPSLRDWEVRLSAVHGLAFTAAECRRSATWIVVLLCNLGLKPEAIKCRRSATGCGCPSSRSV